MGTSTLTSELCACGVDHPEGFVCTQAKSLLQAAKSLSSCSCGCGHPVTDPVTPAESFALADDKQDSADCAIYHIAEMDCPVEEALIRKKLAGMPGVLVLEFNLMQRILKVQYEPAALSAISKALDSLNMGARLMKTGTEKDGGLPAAQIPWQKLLAAGIFAVLSEAFELLHTWQLHPFGLDPQSWQINGFAPVVFAPLVFALVAIWLGGLSTYKKGWLAIRNRNLNINALMSVAVTGAVFIRQYPEAAMVMVLFNLSEAIEAKAMDRARKAIKNLLAWAPKRATVLQPNGAWMEVDIRQVPVGSRVRVRPGEKVALDGVIVQGQSALNQAAITGESMPVEKGVGDVVYAGTLNESGSFEFTVSALAAESTLARIIHAVEEAQASRAPMQRFIDRFASYYTPLVFLVSLLSALLPLLGFGVLWSESIYTALVILVIGCPCALVISTPVTIVSAMAAATRYGILIKGGLFLEQGRRLTQLALDKTGTLTHGRPQQTDVVLCTSGSTPHRVTALAASIAARSDHPVSKAIAAAAQEKGVQLHDVAEFTAIPGRGVSGIIDDEKWFLGNYRIVEELNKGSHVFKQQAVALEKMGKTVVALVGEQGVQALFAVADTLKKSSIKAIEELKRLGVHTMMLTGDNEHAAQAIAKQVGVDGLQANLLPADKLKMIEQLGKEGVVGMVGDGINDAPALARADIGFAMAGGGTDTAIETADVALMDDDLLKIPRFIRLSRSTHTILVQNISFALGIKALFFALAFSGHATMWMAVLADVGAALLVIANGLRARHK